MQIVSLKKGEILRIGEDVRLVIGRFRAKGLEIGIEAPRNIAVHREEFLEARYAQNRVAEDDDSSQERLKLSE